MIQRIHAKALVHFDAIRRYGSIRQAARQLHLSSSALNRQLLELESQIGAPLFERLSSGLRLTPSGEVLARHVIHVLQDAQRLELELQALQGLHSGHVELVTVEALTHAFVPAILKQMAQHHPGVSTSVRIAGSSKAAEAVEDGSADVAIGFVHQRRPGLRQLAVAPFDLGAVVPPTHPLASRETVTFAQCAQYPLVLPTPEISIFQALDPLLRAHPQPLQVIIQTSSFELVKQMACQGRGVAFLNQLGIEDELRRKSLVHLPLKKTQPSLLGIYVRAGRSLPPAIDRFCRLAAQQMEEGQAS